MECPQCGSENVFETNRRGLEKVFQLFSSKKPYQCKECWARFVKSSPKPKGKSSSSLRYLIILLLILIPLLWYKFYRTPEPEVQVARKPPVKSVQTAPKPVKNPTVTTTLPATPATTVPEPVSTTVASLASAKPEDQPKPSPDKPLQGTSVTSAKPEDKPTETKTEKIDQPPGTPPETIATAPPVMTPQPETKTEISSTSEPEPKSVSDEKKENIAGPTVSDAGLKESVPITDIGIEEPAKVLKPSAPQKVTEKDALKSETVKTRADKEKPQGTNSIQKIIAEQKGNEVMISVSSDQPIKKYKRFFMHEPPPRLVLNIYGDWRYSGPTELNIKSDFVQNIRIGKHDTFLSIVLDLNMKDPVIPKIKESSDGLVLHLKKLM